jgi:hypothetical protein
MMAVCDNKLPFSMTSPLAAMITKAQSGSVLSARIILPLSCRHPGEVQHERLGDRDTRAVLRIWLKGGRK